MEAPTTRSGKQYASEATSPFFILGCVRSGTTMLRDFMRLHPRLECPEETHFFRWADNFAGYGYETHYDDDEVFAQHRDIDGISSQDFFKALNTVGSRREMADWYANKFLHLHENPEGRWFDKSPQNVYGVLLISAAYPESKFIHIHRNPLNVVASLREGKVMPVQSLRAGISYWVESMMILSQFRQFAPSRVLELSYERMTLQPEPCLRECFHFVGENDNEIDYSQVSTYQIGDKYKEVLSEGEIRQVVDTTEPYFSLYGYRS